MRGEALSRQLKLLQLLEARPGGVELDEAADALGRGKRTIYRDFELLEELGVPLVPEREGKRARWRIMEGFRHRLQLSLTWSEVLALSTGSELMAGLAGTVFHEGAVSALEKIRATLPKPLAERVASQRRTVSASRGGHDYASRGALLRTLLEAISEKRTVAARYRTASGASSKQRRLDPYHLRVTQQGIYVIAWCHQAREPKTFLLDRFDSAALTGERFSSAPFDGARFLSAAFGMWSGEPRKVEFTVAPKLAHLLLERKAHESQRAQRRSDGSVEVTLNVAIGPPLVSYLCGLGPDVGGIKPDDLRREVERMHRESLRGHQTRRYPRGSRT